MEMTYGFKIRAQLLLTSLIVLFGSLTSILSSEVRIAVLLPFDETRMFSVKRARPAIEYAIDYLKNETDDAFGTTFTVTYQDTNCAAADGMNAAVRDVYLRGSQPHVFLGPICDYTLAPVARQVLYWNIPLISVGAFSRDFTDYHPTEYRLLTRVGPMKFDSMCDTFLGIVKHHSWNRFIIIYDKEGQNNYMEGYCHLAASSLHYDTKSQAPNISQDYFKIMGDFGDILKYEVGLKYGGM